MQYHFNQVKHNQLKDNKWLSATRRPKAEFKIGFVFDERAPLLHIMGALNKAKLRQSLKRLVVTDRDLSCFLDKVYRYQIVCFQYMKCNTIGHSQQLCFTSVATLYNYKIQKGDPITIAQLMHSHGMHPIVFTAFDLKFKLIKNN